MDIFREIEEKLSSPVLRPNGMMYLSDKYIPEKPLYREGHIRELASEIYEMVETNLPGIILLEGPTGTGKTMCYSIAESFLLKKIANKGLASHSENTFRSLKKPQETVMCTSASMRLTR